MNWVFPSLILVAVIHTIAIVSGRSLVNIEHRVAFGSGILGLLSIPLVVILGLASFCIAGGCSHEFDTADLAAVAFVVLALASAISLVLIRVRRTRA